MQKDYEKLKEKILKFGTINLTDLELNQLLFLEEDLKEKNAQKRLLQACGIHAWSSLAEHLFEEEEQKDSSSFFLKRYWQIYLKGV